MKTARLLRESSERVRRQLHQLASPSTFGEMKPLALRQSKEIVQRIQNLNLSRSALQIADQALAQQEELLQRMSALRLSAANSTLSSAERNQLQKEWAQLIDEINRLGRDTQFNGLRLIDNSPEKLSWAVNSIESSLFTTPTSTASNLFKINVGTGSFRSGDAQLIATQGVVKTGDFNQDGLMDYATVNASPVEIYLNRGEGRFQKSESVNTDVGVFNFGDINGDGAQDLIYDIASGELGVNFGSGDGRFQNVGLTASTSFNGHLGTGDIDGDGRDEIAKSDAFGNVQIFKFNGASLEVIATIDDGIAGSAAYFIELKDFNNDGNLDLFYTTYGDTWTSYLQLGDGTGAFGSQIEFGSLAADGVSPDFADFNQDGFLDIAWSSFDNNGFYLGFGSASGTFTPFVVNTDVMYVVTDIEVGDINRDGFLDLAIVGDSVSGGQLRTYFGNGSGSFSLQSTVSRSGILPNPGSVALEDFTGDGILDLLDSTQTRLNVGRSKTQSLIPQLEEGVALEWSEELIQNALMQVQASRSRVGIELSKLELSETSLTRNQELIQNELESLEDPAEQIAELTREQILQNARIAVLAQANLQQQIVLQLLQLD